MRGLASVKSMEWVIQGLLAIALCCLTVASPTGTRSSGGQLNWQLRIDAAWRTLMKADCSQGLYLSSDCAQLKSVPRSEMNIYVSNTVGSDKLVTVFVEKMKGKLAAHDAVLVVDPYPDAHFGHSLLIFVIDVNVRIDKCQTKTGEFYINDKGKGECLQLALTEACRNQIGQSRKGRRRCEFNHVPLVHRKTDSTLKQQLRCESGFFGFGQCRTNHPTIVDRCVNSGRCSSPLLKHTNGHFPMCFHKCDQAVLVSGGWNYLMNQPRHLDNMKSMWNYLKSKGYLEDNIQIFHANNGSIDLDGDRNSKEIIPATEAGGILRHVRNVCRRGPHCVDSFTIYLNGPTLKNGNLLLWDRNKDGIADGTEMLRIRQLLERLHDCNASWVNIIADQNYAGHLVDKVKDAHNNKLNPVYNKISVFASSNKRSYTWGKYFTTNWINLDNKWFEAGYQETGRRLSLVFKDVNQRLPSSKFHLSSFQAPGSDTRTIYGQVGEQIGCSFNRYSLSRMFLNLPRKRISKTRTANTKSRTGGTKVRSRSSRQLA